MGEGNKVDSHNMPGPGKHFYVHRETGTIQRMPADLFHPKVEGVGHIRREVQII